MLGSYLTPASGYQDTKYVISYDDGETWGDVPAQLEQGGNFNVDGKMYRSESNPCTYGQSCNWRRKMAMMYISSDDGLTWSRFGTSGLDEHRTMVTWFYRGKQYLHTYIYAPSGRHGVDGPYYSVSDGPVYFIEIDYQKFSFNPNASEDACKQACNNDPLCCIYIWNSNTNCCTLRNAGCYERNGLPSNDFENMCTVDDSQSYPGIKSVAKNCPAWCKNSPVVPSCNTSGTNKPITSSCNIKVPRHLQYIASKARLNKQADITKSCKINKPIIGAKKLAKKIYAQVEKTMRMPKRKSWPPAKRQNARVRIYMKCFIKDFKLIINH